MSGPQFAGIDFMGKMKEDEIVTEFVIVEDIHHKSIVHANVERSM